MVRGRLVFAVALTALISDGAAPPALAQSQVLVSPN